MTEELLRDLLADLELILTCRIISQFAAKPPLRDLTI